MYALHIIYEFVEYQGPARVQATSQGARVFPLCTYNIDLEVLGGLEDLKLGSQPLWYVCMYTPRGQRPRRITNCMRTYVG